jgi:hypothetical protein
MWLKIPPFKGKPTPLEGTFTVRIRRHNAASEHKMFIAARSGFASGKWTTGKMKVCG